MLGPVVGESGALGEGGGWFDADGRLAEARPCLGCGYELRGCSAGESCPECGRAVRESLVGPMLARADAGWVRRLRFGSELGWWAAAGAVVAASSIAGVTLSGVWLSYSPTFAAAVAALSSDIAMIAFHTLVALGVISGWLLTFGEPSPWGAAHPLPGRAWARWFAVAAASALVAWRWAVFVWTELGPHRPRVVTALLLTAAAVVVLAAWGWAGSRVVGRLGWRLASRRLRQRAWWAGRLGVAAAAGLVSLMLTSVAGTMGLIPEPSPRFMGLFIGLFLVWFASTAAATTLWALVVVATMATLRAELRRAAMPGGAA